MKKFALTLLTFFIVQPCFAWNFDCFKGVNSDEQKIKKVFETQIRYANKENFNKFIKTFDKSYLNDDGFDYEVYSALIKDIWSQYDDIKYGAEIKKIQINGDSAVVDVYETTEASLQMSKVYSGELQSNSNTVYNLKKFANGDWRIVSDCVLDETTTMLYGNAQDLKVKLTVPESVEPNSDYTVSLEFVPPNDTLAIASLAADIVEYPQKPTKEVFRAMPEDNILERILTSNDKNANEYVVASIGLTKTSVCNMNLNLNLTGFGYVVKRVNISSQKNEEISNVQN